MEKMNCELKELSLDEQKDISGGNPLLAFIAVVGALAYLYNNKEDFVAGFKEGYESVRK
jgi:hypothetical protein